MTEQVSLDDGRHHVRAEVTARLMAAGALRNQPAQWNVGTETAFEWLGAAWAHAVVNAFLSALASAAAADPDAADALAAAIAAPVPTMMLMLEDVIHYPPTEADGTSNDNPGGAP